ncbi:MAG: DNA-directed RNA polymerase subunit P [Candidatus Diapherotrites archaeon]|nr:DNA-directed RNA polymerase subunit P [Candidatus Diapherotrites archaeon]
MTFRCVKCGAEVMSVVEGTVRCPKCGYRILYKTREPISKELKAV